MRRSHFFGAMVGFLLAVAPSVLFAGEAEDLIADEIYYRWSDELHPRSELKVRFTRPFAKEVVDVIDIHWEPSTHRFIAVLEFEGEQYARVTGVAQALVEIPVPLRSIESGEILQRSDLTTKTVPAMSLNSGIVDDLADLVGQEARRTILAGRPVQVNNIVSPRIIDRNESVTMIYNTGGLSIVGRGRSLSSASIGDIVRIAPSAGGTPIEAEVVSAGVVRVFD